MVDLRSNCTTKITGATAPKLVTLGDITFKYMQKRLNTFIASIVINLIIFCWSFYEYIQTFIKFDPIYYYIYFIYGGIVLLSFILAPGIGKKLKHRKKDIGEIDAIIYKLSLVWLVFKILSIKSITIKIFSSSDYFSGLTYIISIIYLILSFVLSALNLKTILIKVKIWLKWGDVIIK